MHPSDRHGKVWDIKTRNQYMFRSLYSTDNEVGYLKQRKRLTHASQWSSQQQPPT
jgi:hypothetical protein